MSYPIVCPPIIIPPSNDKSKGGTPSTIDIILSIIFLSIVIVLGVYIIIKFNSMLNVNLTNLYYRLLYYLQLVTVITG